MQQATQQEELDLILYCEWEKNWHPTRDSIYRFRPEQEWFSKLKEKWGEFAKVTKRVAPLAGIGGAVIGVPAAGAAMKEMAERAEALSGEAKGSSRVLTEELGMREQRSAIDLEAKHLLKRLIEHLDSLRGEAYPPFGGLHPYHLKEDGRLLWQIGRASCRERV